MVGWFRRFRLPPSLLVLLRLRRPPLFFSLAFSGFARSGPGVSVLVFSSSLFFCFPLLVSRLSSFCPIFMLISFSSPFHPHLHLIHPDLNFLTLPRAVCVCVRDVCRDGKLHMSIFTHAGGMAPICLSSPMKLGHFGG